jgi:hypothetical protein
MNPGIPNLLGKQLQRAGVDSSVRELNRSEPRTTTNLLHRPSKRGGCARCVRLADDWARSVNLLESDHGISSRRQGSP